MTYEEFKRHLGKAGLNIKEFAKLIKQAPNSITNHSKHGSVPPHLAIIAALLGAMRDNKVDFFDVLNSIEYEQSKARGGSQKGLFGGDKQGSLSLEEKES